MLPPNYTEFQSAAFTVELTSKKSFLFFSTYKMDNVSIDDKVKIASEFLLSSPPGEVNDVFNGKKKAYLK